METETFGDRVREARLAKGLTQKAVADETGAAESTVASWELQSRLPRRARLVRLAHLLGKTVTWLLEGDGPTRRERLEKAAAEIDDVRALLLKKTATWEGRRLEEPERLAAIRVLTALFNMDEVAQFAKTRQMAEGAIAPPAKHNRQAVIPPAIARAADQRLRGGDDRGDGVMEDLQERDVAEDHESPGP